MSPQQGLSSKELLPDDLLLAALNCHFPQSEFREVPKIAVPISQSESKMELLTSLSGAQPIPYEIAGAFMREVELPPEPNVDDFKLWNLHRHELFQTLTASIREEKKLVSSARQRIRQYALHPPLMTLTTVTIEQFSMADSISNNFHLYRQLRRRAMAMVMEGRLPGN
jgi:hypothetical protein